MKVLQILPSLEVGGVERGVIDLARAMKKRGHEAVVISSGGQLVSELEKMGVPHYSLGVHQKSLSSLFLVPKIAEVIRREHVDIVHARSRVPAWLAWLATRQTGTPFVTTCHGYYSKHFLSRIMGWGKRVIVISRVIGRHMIDDFGVAQDRVRLIHRGLDLTQFTLKRPENTASEKNRTFRIVNVARLSPIKGQIEFLKAVHILRRNFQQVEVWLVGSEGGGKNKYTQQIQETIKHLGLESCVRLLGTRRDIPEVLEQSDLLVLSTLVPEAFGRVVIEAGAVGVPVIATKLGGVLDIIDEGVNGVLVPPGDIEAMAEAMEKLVLDPDKAKEMAVNLRKKVENEFTLDQMVNKTLDVYNEILRQKKILVIKLGAAGDLILAVPSLRMIRKRFPSASVSILVDKKFSPLISDSPYVDEVFPIDRNKLSNISYLLKLAKKMRFEGYDISVDLQNSKWTHLLASFAGIEKRYGFSRGKFGKLLNRPDGNFEKVDSPIRHQFRILSKLGIKDLDETLELWTTEDSEKKVDQLLADAGVEPGTKLVGFVLGSSPKWLTKRWPLDYFKKLAGHLVQNDDCRIVLLGSDADREYAAHFFSKDEKGIINLLGKTSLADLVALVKRLEVLVTGDTAPLHVAIAVKTKVVALFGPTDPRRHMPASGNSTVLSRRLSCQPCYQGKCKNEEELACLKRISVEEVFEAVRKQLDSKKETSQPPVAHRF